VPEPPASPQGQASIVEPHPLTVLLIERLRGAPGSRVLDFGSGRGRNAVALRRAGLTVVAVDDSIADSAQPLAGITGPFAAAISTHGFLHGRLEAIEARLYAVASRLEEGGVLYATFGSSRDARFGHGRRLDQSTFAPTAGDERGVAHTFLDRDRLATLLAPHFVIESLEERGVDEIAGAWAHRERPLEAAAHWFAIARKRAKAE
jgi:hypothetical protein